ncbi:glycerophosphoryl diester phosphodiesterase [Amycolatopsis marina]|uniref:Glycerophosphoryl diester phosphodiesterase n=1 Tax=Amycolatopsis marina TaxID=490629 RepID=A0A1I1BWJ8_9PSEU|nr:glycerophosphodiester phosphodiesterase family protein [Amycolatopsis marina]SFB54784.1 glycerophosphoryl diester phosphodiesterase [Amycolatopsis marina]
MQPQHPYLATPGPRAFAHRGWHLGELAELENSLPAFQRAVAEGYHYLETDVHATADGVLVALHDVSLDRTTDRTGPVAGQRWAEVRRAKIGGKVELSRLEDLLEELPSAFFNVDVKSAAAVEPFLEVLARTGTYNRVAAASFSDARLARLRRLAGPRLLTAMGPRSVAALWAHGYAPFLRLGTFCRGAMAQVPIRQGAMTIVHRGFLRAAQLAGAEVHTWTVDDRAEMCDLLDLGVHGIVTDRPDVLREVLLERGAWHTAA